MTPTQFSEIKDSVASAKEKKAKAEGAMEKIEENWKEEYSLDSCEEVNNKIHELNDSIEADKKKLEKMYTQLEAITDWEKVN